MEKPRTTRKSPRQHHPSRDPGPEKMSSWLERQASSHQVQLAATALLSGVAVAGLIYASQNIRRKAAVDELKASIPELNENHHADLVSRTAINKSFSRLTESLNSMLTILVKLTNFGAASPVPASNKEDARSVVLAHRAQHGEYDEGDLMLLDVCGKGCPKFGPRTDH